MTPTPWKFVSHLWLSNTIEAKTPRMQQLNARNWYSAKKPRTKTSGWKLTNSNIKQIIHASFYLIIFIYTLKVALPARLLKAPLLRPEGSALLPWKERDVINFWRSIVITFSCSLFIEIHHSLIQQQGRNLMEIHGIFVQFVDLFPLFPSSLLLVSFLMTHLQVLGLELCAVDLGFTPPHSMENVETTRPEGWSYSWFVTKIPTPMKLQLSFWIFVNKIWWTSFCHFFLLSSSLFFFPALRNQHVFYFLI